MFSDERFYIIIGSHNDYNLVIIEMVQGKPYKISLTRDGIIYPAETAVQNMLGFSTVDLHLQKKVKHHKRRTSRRLNFEIELVLYQRRLSVPIDTSIFGQVANQGKKGFISFYGADNM
ncbi:hypothetical protein C5167_026271, partial [Papaver somniferum]